MLLGRAGWKGQLRPESRQKQRETNKWKRVLAGRAVSECCDAFSREETSVGTFLVKGPSGMVDVGSGDGGM